MVVVGAVVVVVGATVVVTIEVVVDEAVDDEGDTASPGAEQATIETTAAMSQIRRMGSTIRASGV